MSVQQRPSDIDDTDYFLSKITGTAVAKKKTSSGLSSDDAGGGGVKKKISDLFRTNESETDQLLTRDTETDKKKRGRVTLGIFAGLLFIGFAVGVALFFIHTKVLAPIFPLGFYGGLVLGGLGCFTGLIGMIASCNRSTIIRVLYLFFAVICVLCCLVGIALGVLGGTNMDKDLEKRWHEVVNSHPEKICAFEKHYECSGWKNNCADELELLKEALVLDGFNPNDIGTGSSGGDGHHANHTAPNKTGADEGSHSVVSEGMTSEETHLERRAANTQHAVTTEGSCSANTDCSGCISNFFGGCTWCPTEGICTSKTGCPGGITPISGKCPASPTPPTPPAGPPATPTPPVAPPVTPSPPAATPAPAPVSTPDPAPPATPQPPVATPQPPAGTPQPAAPANTPQPGAATTPEPKSPDSDTPAPHGGKVVPSGSDSDDGHHHERHHGGGGNITTDAPSTPNPPAPPAKTTPMVRCALCVDGKAGAAALSAGALKNGGGFQNLYNTTCQQAFEKKVKNRMYFILGGLGAMFLFLLITCMLAWNSRARIVEASVPSFD